MFGSNRAYDELSARNVELAREIKRKDEKIENRNILIADMKKQATALYEENKDLRFENEEQKHLIDRIARLVNSNKYSNEKAILNKIKELVNDDQSTN